jgi:hypothetical protein
MPLKALDVQSADVLRNNSQPSFVTSIPSDIALRVSVSRNEFKPWRAEGISHFPELSQIPTPTLYFILLPLLVT